MTQEPRAYSHPQYRVVVPIHGSSMCAIYTPRATNPLHACVEAIEAQQITEYEQGTVCWIEVVA